MATALEKVRIELAKRRVRIEEQFADFDRLRSGNVSKEQFKRCLTICNVLNSISESEFASLSVAYMGKDALHVDYKSFMADINAEEVPFSALSPARSGRQLDDDMERALAKMTEFFVHQINTKGLDVRQCFRDFDRHNCGKITVGQFERSFPFRVDPRFLRAIEDKYSDGNGNIMYLGWCNDILNNGRQGGEARKAATSRTTAATVKVEAERVLVELRAQMATKRLRVDEYLRDYDKNRSGTVTVGQFTAAVGRLQLSRFVLGERELAALIERYAFVDSVGVQKVNYPQFVYDIDPTVKDAELKPPVNTLPNEQEQQVNSIIAKIRTAVRTRRVNMKPTFQDFDRAVKGIYQSRTCTKSRFERALAINKINLSVAEVALLEKKYAVAKLDGTLSEDINYYEFCAAVDMNTENPEVVSPVNVPTIQQPPVPRTVQNVLDKMMLQALDRRVRLQEFIRDFDGLRSGTIANSKFASAVGIAGLQLDQEDFEILYASFAHASLPDTMDINALLRSVDTGVVIDNAASPSSPARDNEQDLRTRLGATDEEVAGELAPQFNLIIARISDAVRSRGVLLPPFFHDYDKHHSGRITRSQFHQVLTRHQFPVTHPDIELLSNVYADKTDSTQIRYRRFIGAVDETENVGQQHAARTQTRKDGSVLGQTNTMTGTVGPVEGVLEKVRDFIRRRGARINEFFHDNDQLRKGSLHSGKFRSSLDMTGIYLTEGDHQTLCEAFASTTQPNAVDYVAFLRAVEQGGSGQGSNENRSEGLEPYIQKLVERVRKSVESRRLITRPMFQDYDKLRKGKVTEAQFFSALTTINVRFAPMEAEALRSFLSAGEQNMLNYIKFSELVDPVVV